MTLCASDDCGVCVCVLIALGVCSSVCLFIYVSLGDCVCPCVSLHVRLCVSLGSCVWLGWSAKAPQDSGLSFPTQAVLAAIERIRGN